MHHIAGQNKIEEEKKMMLLDLIRKCERFIKRHNWGGGECPSALSEHGGVILWKLTDSPNFFGRVLVLDKPVFSEQHRKTTNAQLRAISCAYEGLLIKIIIKK